MRKAAPRLHSEEKQLLRVLFVEDCLEDLEFNLLHLERGGLEVKADHVQNRGDFEEKLAVNSYDIVIADYRLPEWRGLDAVDVLKAHGKDIPVIIVTGSLGDELAAECIRRGASDYILKDRLARLPAAVRRALDERAMRGERVRAEEALRLRTKALETAANAVVITDREGRITWVNPAFARLTGYAPAEVLGQTPRFLKSGEHDEAFYRSMWEAVLAGRVWQGELINRRKDGTLYTEDQTITPMFNDRGEISHFISIKQDATERKQAEQQRIRALQLQAENEALARADRLKSEFLADMSHEFRTPLNSILGFSELLLEICQNLTPEQQEDLRLVYQSAQNLLHLVNDSLDLARIEAGHVKLERSIVPLKDSFARILDVFAPRLQQNNLRGGAEVHPPGLAVFADGRRLEQILTNLVGNAVKFTGRGGITLSARTTEGGVLVSVADTGVGIPAEELPHIFNKFYQARKQTESATRGTGLGLAITRQLVELHGGRIWAQSTPGEGTTVSFVLPGEEAAQSVRAKEQGRVASANRAGS